MTAAATATAAGGRAAGGRWPRNRRRMGDRLHALLATVAIGSCVVRTLDADERAVRFRPADGLKMFNWSRRGSGDGH